MGRMYFVVGAVLLSLGIIIGLLISCVIIKEDLLKTNKVLAEKSEINSMVYKWISNSIKGRAISQYLIEHGVYKIAIYGLGYLGELVLDELIRDKICVECIIDRNADCLYTDIFTCKPDDHIPEVDAILVTPIQYFDAICFDLRNKVNCPIISIADVIYSIQ